MLYQGRQSWGQSFSLVRSGATAGLSSSVGLGRNLGTHYWFL